jgi:hypothetical protein
MLQMLESHPASHFHFLWTGNESWMFYLYLHEAMWQRRGRKWTNLGGRRIITRRRSSVPFSMVQGATS